MLRESKGVRSVQKGAGGRGEAGDIGGNAVVAGKLGKAGLLTTAQISNALDALPRSLNLILHASQNSTENLLKRKALR